MRSNVAKKQLESKTASSAASRPYRIEDQIGYLLRRAHQRASAIFQTGIGDPNITPTQYSSLAKLDEYTELSQNLLGRLVGMDKATMKTIFRAHGLPVVEHLVVLRREWRRAPAEVRHRVAEAIGFPCFAKPSNLGSSVGISRVPDAAALPAALDEAARHDRKLLVERAVRGREIEVSVLGNDEPRASLPGEITYGGAWYDYATKYAEGQARLTVPAPVTPVETRRFQELALAAFRAIDCAGMARVDFLVPPGGLYLSELNTIPGFTPISLFPTMPAEDGLDFAAVCRRLIELALERHADRPAGSRAGGALRPRAGGNLRSGWPPPPCSACSRLTPAGWPAAQAPRTSRAAKAGSAP